MAKLLIILCLSLVVAHFSVISGQKRIPAVEVNLKLDRINLYLPCRPHQTSKYRDCLDGMTIKVRTKAKGPHIGKMNYKYVVSGGQVFGRGSNIVWDMSAVQPGTYEITARVYDDHAPIGNPASAENNGSTVPGLQRRVPRLP